MTKAELQNHADSLAPFLQWASELTGDSEHELSVGILLMDAKVAESAKVAAQLLEELLVASCNLQPHP